MQRYNYVILIFFFSAFTFSFNLNAQEIQATVNIDNEQIQNTEKSIFVDMKNNIQQFLNTRRWTNDRYAQNEKVKLTISIKLQDQPSIGRFKGFAQITVARPVYGVGYETSTINFIDKDFNFEYNLSQPMDFNENAYTTNLTSLLAFYAYIALGMDYDSFARLGGSPYFEKAQLILNTAQTSPEDGWRQTGSNPNSRFWLNENLNSPTFKDFRETTYNYYRLGLDEMATKPEEARAKIIECLAILKRINDTRPNSVLVRTYFNTKDTELVNILTEATGQEKMRAVEMLKSMDPTNTEKYEKILK